MLTQEQGMKMNQDNERLVDHERIKQEVNNDTKRLSMKKPVIPQDTNNHALHVNIGKLQAYNPNSNEL